MIRITIELDEARADDSFRQRLERCVERDKRVLRRLRDDEPPFQIPGVPVRFT